MLKPLHVLDRATAALFIFYLVLMGGTCTHLAGQSKLNGGQTRILTNVQSGATYTVLVSDCGKLISFSNSGQVAVTLPQAGPAGLPAGCWIDFQNTAASAVTLKPANSLIDQASSLQLTVNQGVRLVSNGTGFLTQRGQGQGSGGSGGGTGSVTNTQGSLTAGALVTGNGGSDVRTAVSSATMDDKGNISIPGTLTTNTGCNNCAGAIDLGAGTDPGPSPLANSFSWIAPLSIPAAYRWRVPAADSAGAIVSDGAATPGTLSIVPLSGSGNIVRATSPAITTATLIQPILQSYTVAALPAGVLGKSVYVTDGVSTSDCTTGGGANKVLCVYNGSAWTFPGPTGGGGGNIAGSGTTVSVGLYAAKPTCSTTAFLYIPTDWANQYFCDGANNMTVVRPGSGYVLPPGSTVGFTGTAPSGGSPTLIQAADAITLQGGSGMYSSAVFGNNSSIETEASYMSRGGGQGCGPGIWVDSQNWTQVAYIGYAFGNFVIHTVINGSLSDNAQVYSVYAGTLRWRVRASSGNLIYEVSTDNGRNYTSLNTLSGNPYSLTLAALGGTPHPAYICRDSVSATVYHWNFSL